MREEDFQAVLRYIKLPLGELLSDNSTYRVTSADFFNIPTRLRKELNGLEKFLVLTCNREYIVGGVLFYGNTDIQVVIFPEYRAKHFMSEIHKNGVLKSECYPNQQVKLEKNAIESFDDFQMKHYLLSSAGLKISNLSEIHDYFNKFMPCKKLEGFQRYSEEEFLKKFS